MTINFKNIFKPGTVAGVTLWFENPQEFRISFTKLQRKGNDISVETTKSGITSIEEFLEILPKNVPLALNISGKVLVNKEFENKSDFDISQLIPANQLDDFYCSTFEGQKLNAYSLCRRKTVDDVLQKFTADKRFVVGLNFGPYQVSKLWDYGLINTESILIPSGKLVKESDDKIKYQTDYQQNSTDVFLGKERIPYGNITDYAIALSWLTEDLKSNFSGEGFPEIQNDFFYKNIIDKTRYIVLAVVFILLLANFAVNESFRKKSTYISEQLVLYEGIISKRDSLQKQLELKESFIDYIGQNQTYNSFFLDKIAATVPGSISLNTLQINPLASKMQKSEPVNFEKKILISGMAKNTLIVNQWSTDLSRLEWVKKVNVLNYEHSDEDQKGEFLIELLTND